MLFNDDANALGGTRWRPVVGRYTNQMPIWPGSLAAVVNLVLCISDLLASVFALSSDGGERMAWKVRQHDEVLLQVVSSAVRWAR